MGGRRAATAGRELGRRHRRIVGGGGNFWGRRRLRVTGNRGSCNAWSFLGTSELAAAAGGGRGRGRRRGQGDELVLHVGQTARGRRGGKAGGNWRGNIPGYLICFCPDVGG